MTISRTFVQNLKCQYMKTLKIKKLTQHQNFETYMSYRRVEARQTLLHLKLHEQTQQFDKSMKENHVTIIANAVDTMTKVVEEKTSFIPVQMQGLNEESSTKYDVQNNLIQDEKLLVQPPPLQNVRGIETVSLTLGNQTLIIPENTSSSTGIHTKHKNSTPKVNIKSQRSDQNKPVTKAFFLLPITLRRTTSKDEDIHQPQVPVQNQQIIRKLILNPTSLQPKNIRLVPLIRDTDKHENENKSSSVNIQKSVNCCSSPDVSDAHQSQILDQNQSTINKLILNPQFLQPQRNLESINLIPTPGFSGSEISSLPSFTLGSGTSTIKRIHKCGRCKKNFFNPSDLKKHRYKMHRVKSHKCDKCTKSFHYICQLKVHQQSHSNVKMYSCDICKKRYKSKVTLKVHSNSHNCDYFHCDLCERKFLQHQALKRHIEEDHLNKKYKCEVCGKEYGKESSFRDHKRTHDSPTVTNKFKCDYCDIAFARNYQLRRHKQVHLGTYPMCDICGKQVTTVGSLRNHMRRHTGEKPFVCEICNRPFISKKLLRGHIRVHIKEKPYLCEVCGKEFSQVGSVKIHMRSVHLREKPFECNICKKRFPANVQLRNHLKTHGTPLAELIGDRKI